MIKVKFDAWGETHEVELYKGIYGNGRLAVEAIDTEEGEPYCTITVNLPNHRVSSGECAYLDSNNCPAGLVRALYDAEIMERVGGVGMSGYCVYPQVKFNRLEEMEVIE